MKNLYFSYFLLFSNIYLFGQIDSVSSNELKIKELEIKVEREQYELNKMKSLLQQFIFSIDSIKKQKQYVINLSYQGYKVDINYGSINLMESCFAGKQHIEKCKKKNSVFVFDYCDKYYKVVFNMNTFYSDTSGINKYLDIDLVKEIKIFKSSKEKELLKLNNISNKLKKDHDSLSYNFKVKLDEIISMKDAISVLEQTIKEENENKIKEEREEKYNNLPESKKAFAKMYFGMTYDELDEFNGSNPFSTIGDYEYYLKKDFDNNELFYSLTIESFSKTANYLDTKILREMNNLYKVIKAKYGNPSITSKIPTIFSFAPGYMITVYQWNLGDKILRIGIGEEYSSSEYYAFCLIYSNSMKKAYIEYQNKESKKNLIDSSKNF